MAYKLPGYVKTAQKGRKKVSEALKVKKGKKAKAVRAKKK